MITSIYVKPQWKALLSHLKISEKEVARRINVDPSTLNQKVNGHKNFRLDELLMLNQEVGITTTIKDGQIIFGHESIIR